MMKAFVRTLNPSIRFQFGAEHGTAFSSSQIAIPCSLGQLVTLKVNQPLQKLTFPLGLSISRLTPA